jgi:hypothetical protein
VSFCINIIGSGYLLRFLWGHMIAYGKAAVSLICERRNRNRVASEEALPNPPQAPLLNLPQAPLLNLPQPPTLNQLQAPLPNPPQDSVLLRNFPPDNFFLPSHRNIIEVEGYGGVRLLGIPIQNSGNSQNVATSAKVSKMVATKAKASTRANNEQQRLAIMEADAD